jgi:hypothetical protein
MIDVTLNLYNLLSKANHVLIIAAFVFMLYVFVLVFSFNISGFRWCAVFFLDLHTMSRFLEEFIEIKSSVFLQLD